MCAGAIGVPAVFRSQTCDKLDPSGFFVTYAQFSGGIFVDCSIHDIDLALWFLGHGSSVVPIVKSVSAVGITAISPEQEDCTEVTGTKGKLSINTQPATNHVSITDPLGIRREIPPDYYGRYMEAFITEANEFTQCCLDDSPLPFDADGAVEAVRIGAALQESLITNRRIDFDEQGERITPVVVKNSKSMEREEQQLQAKL